MHPTDRKRHGTEFTPVLAETASDVAARLVAESGPFPAHLLDALRDVVTHPTPGRVPA